MKINKRQKPLSNKGKIQKVTNAELKAKTQKFMSNFKKMSAAELQESRCKAYNYAL